MNIRLLLAAGLIGLLSLLNLSAAERPSYAHHTPEETRETRGLRGGILSRRAAQDAQVISLAEYWELVSETRQAIFELEAKPEATIRQELNALASQWDQVTAVELLTGEVIPVDSYHLAAQLREEPARLERLKNLLEALLQAHEEYPQQVFTVEDVAPLKAILAQPEFQWQQPATPRMPDWLANLYDRLIAFRDWIFLQVVEALYGGRDLYKILAVLLFLFSLFFIARGLSRSLAREAQIAVEDNESDELLTSQGAFKRAETLSMQGDYRNAIRYLYLSSLLVLDEQGLMRYDRSRTNREYLRSVSSKPELANPLQAVIDVFDRVWYGFESVDEQTYRSYVERVDELREKKE